MKVRERLGWRVPILMYHRVVEGEPDVAAYYFSISRDRFERQMRLLQALRFHVVTLEQVALWAHGKGALPPRPVAITFDDGYQDTYEVAAPILERFGFPAALFLVADRVGGRSEWDATPTSNGHPLMDWNQASDLSQCGFTIGSHSRTHADLPALDDKRLQAEVAGSRRIIENRLGQPVRFFAYPRNACDARCEAAARAAGYLAACAGDARPYHPWCLDRVDPTHASPATFLAKVSPWFYAARRARKRFHRGSVS